MSSLLCRVDPELRSALAATQAVGFPQSAETPAEVRFWRTKLRELEAARAEPTAIHGDVRIVDVLVPDWSGDHKLRLRLYVPRMLTSELPAAICYVHGGGMMLGSVEGDDAIAAMLAIEVSCVVASVDYRLAPEFPYPAAVHDVVSAMRWLADGDARLGIDPERIALYGGSAGGGIAAGAALFMRDYGAVRPVFLMLPYPMLDHRNDSPSSYEIADLGVWDRQANLSGWRAYLGGDPAGEVPSYASPAGAKDLTALPCTYIDVGDLDLFRDEDIAFASRLMRAGIPTELHVYPGAYHGFEKFAPTAQVSVQARSRRLSALRTALGTTISSTERASK